MRIFHVNMATSEGGGRGLHILKLSVVKLQLFVFFSDAGASISWWTYSVIVGAAVLLVALVTAVMCE